MKEPPIVILGGSGLLGRHCHVGLEKKYPVVSTWCSHSMQSANAVWMDLTRDSGDLRKILERHRPNVVINTVAYVTVEGCEKNIELASRLNVEVVRDLVRVLGELNLSKTHLIQVSSDSIYGRRVGMKVPWRESDSPCPLSVYARTKLAGEEAALRHGGPVSILRTAFYGVNPYSTKSLLWWIMDKARNKIPMEGWENIFFSPVSAMRLVDAIKHMINHGITGVFNVGSQDACNKYDFAEAVCSYLGVSATILQTVGDSALRPEYSVLDCAKLATVMPWGVFWRDDLETYLKSVKKHGQYFSSRK